MIYILGALSLALALTWGVEEFRINLLRTDVVKAMLVVERLNNNNKTLTDNQNACQKALDEQNKALDVSREANRVTTEKAQQAAKDASGATADAAKRLQDLRVQLATSTAPLSMMQACTMALDEARRPLR